MKTLIAYYSRGGHTEKAAQKLQEITGGDLFKIEGEKNYGGYIKALGIAQKEFSINEEPKVVNNLSDVHSYDKILVGFPVWFGKCPQLVVSFLNSQNLVDKAVYPFYTSGASNLYGSKNNFNKACKGAIVKNSIRLNKFDDEKVKAWLES